jgi:hypothetical protein
MGVGRNLVRVEIEIEGEGELECDYDWRTRAIFEDRGSSVQVRENLVSSLVSHCSQLVPQSSSFSSSAFLLFSVIFSVNMG